MTIESSIAQTQYSIPNVGPTFKVSPEISKDETSKAESAKLEPLKAIPAPASHLLPKDTPVSLMVLNEVNSKTHKAGSRFRLRVDQVVKFNDTVAIPIGTTAWGEVTATEDHGGAGKAGQLSARLLYIELGDRHIAIEGDTKSKGADASGETAMEFLTMGPLALFAKGHNAKIKAGERMTAFITENVDLTTATSVPEVKSNSTSAGVVK